MPINPYVADDDPRDRCPSSHPAHCAACPDCQLTADLAVKADVERELTHDQSIDALALALGAVYAALDR